jgi:hypothetical protein
VPESELMREAHDSVQQHLQTEDTWVFLSLWDDCCILYGNNYPHN